MRRVVTPLVVGALLVATVAAAAVRMPLQCGGPGTVTCGPASATPSTCSASNVGCGPAHGKK
jgi:hypothetical protein